MKQAQVSIHDVQPETMEATRRMCRTLPLNPCTTRLLIVPGADWNRQALDSLRQLTDTGFRLSAHGWKHRISQWGSLYHRIHGALFSGRVAEHLKLNPKQIEELLHNSCQWFVDNGFPAPDFYVPPAWAMGQIRKDRLRECPFRYYETLSGIYDAKADIHHKLPLIGYEARRFASGPILRVCNAFGNLWSSLLNKPARIAIHPSDTELPLSNSMVKDLNQVETFLDCTDLPQKKTASSYGVLR